MTLGLSLVVSRRSVLYALPPLAFAAPALRAEPLSPEPVAADPRWPRRAVRLLSLIHI